MGFLAGRSLYDDYGGYPTLKQEPFNSNGVLPCLDGLFHYILNSKENVPIKYTPRKKTSPFIIDTLYFVDMSTTQKMIENGKLLVLSKGRRQSSSRMSKDP